MQKIQQNSRLLLRGANGRIYGELVNRTLYKRVFASRHFLRKPVPAIAIDAELYDQYRGDFDEIRVADAETGRTYFLPAKLFDRYRWELERGYGKQYAVALRYWHTEPEEPSEQLSLFAETQQEGVLKVKVGQP